MKRWGSPMLAAAGAALAAWAAASSGDARAAGPPAQAVDPAILATSATCGECHQEQVGAFAMGGHGRAFRHDPRYATADCASCHGDGTKHIESLDAADISNPARLEWGRASQACLTCHDRGDVHRLWRGSEHDQARVTCVDCHAVHAAATAERGILRTASDLCLSCHIRERSSVGSRFRHPLAEDKMNCASCHQPHGARGEHLIAKDSINDLCWSCHQEKRGPFLWEHSPVREDCTTCHVAHGSQHEGMLVARTTQLCQSCHLQGRHQTVAGFQTAMWNTNRGCLNCHSQIHGSNHPSGPLFHR